MGRSSAHIVPRDGFWLRRLRSSALLCWQLDNLYFLSDFSEFVSKVSWTTNFTLPYEDILRLV